MEAIKILPTRTEGLCSYCSWSNPYTEINCERCGARLAWAYLIDGKDDKDFEPPIEKFFSHLFHMDEDPAKSRACCRYCNKPIKPDEKICPHCENVLAWGINFSLPVIDARAPEIRRLYKLYKSKQENENRWKRSDD